KSDFDHVLHVADVHAVAGRAVTVDLDFEIPLTHVLVGDHIYRPRNRAHHRGEIFGHVLNFVEVFPEDLDADHRAHAGCEHVDSSAAVPGTISSSAAGAGVASGPVHKPERSADFISSSMASRLKVPTARSKIASSRRAICSFQDASW